MKRNWVLLTLTIVMSQLFASAQHIQVLMAPKPSPYLANWPANNAVSLKFTNTTTKVISFKISTVLTNGKGAVAAQTDDSKLKVWSLKAGESQTYSCADVFPEKALAEIRTGRLPDDNYRITVQLKDATTGAKIGQPGISGFAIKDNGTK